MEKFQLNEIVWAKVKGYPWWPGIISYYQPKKDLYTINFIGHNTQQQQFQIISYIGIIIYSSLLNEQKIKKYDKNKKQFSLSHPQKLLKSIKIANSLQKNKSQQNQQMTENDTESLVTLSEINQNQKKIKKNIQQDNNLKELSQQMIQFQVLEIRINTEIQKIVNQKQKKLKTQDSQQEFFEKILNVYTQTIKQQNLEFNQLLLENSWGNYYEQIKTLLTHQQQLQIEKLNQEILNNILQQFYGKENKSKLKKSEEIQNDELELEKVPDFEVESEVNTMSIEKYSNKLTQIEIENQESPQDQITFNFLENKCLQMELEFDNQSVKNEQMRKNICLKLCEIIHDKGTEKKNSQKISLLLEQVIRKEHPQMKESYKKEIKSLYQQIKHNNLNYINQIVDKLQ